MPLPNDPQQRKKIAEVMVRLGKMTPEDRQEQLQRIKEIRQDQAALVRRTLCKSGP